MLELINKYQTIGFSGSRSNVDLTACNLAADSVPEGAQIIVGCAAGVDAYFRSRFPAARVFTVDRALGRGGFAARSIACVDAVAAAGGLWVSFPAGACPPGLMPHKSARECFSGRGSGSWGSLAYAIGRGCPVLVWLGSVPTPIGWGLESCDSQGLYQFQPVSKQLSFVNI